MTRARIWSRRLIRAGAAVTALRALTMIAPRSAKLPRISGEYTGVALYGEDDEETGRAGQTRGKVVRYSIGTENGSETLACEPLLGGSPQN